MRFVIVWLLPVPGGPCSTKVLPRAEYSTAVICEESALSGQKVSTGTSFDSTSSGGNTSTPSSKIPPPSTRWLTSGFFRNSSIRLVRSFHITNLPKENCPSAAVRITSQPGWSATAD